MDLENFAGVPRDLGGSLVAITATPSMFCHPCFLKLRRIKMASQDGAPFQPITAVEWTSHTDEDCQVTAQKNNQKNKNKILMIIK